CSDPHLSPEDIAIGYKQLLEVERGWRDMKSILDRLHVGTFTGPAGLFRRRTELSKPQRDLLAKLGIAAPKQIVELKAPN
ncbi:transposase, partial [Streptosporangium canum]